MNIMNSQRIGYNLQRGFMIFRKHFLYKLHRSTYMITCIRFVGIIKPLNNV